MSKQFEVGDKVRNVSDGPAEWYGVGAQIGCVYTVVEVTEGVDGQLLRLAELAKVHPHHRRWARKYELVNEPATVYKVISTDYPECLAWDIEYASVEEAEAGIRESAEPGRTFEIFSVVRTVHKTVKLTERTETIRELNEVK